MLDFALLLFAYLLGSAPTSWSLTRLWQKRDLRAEGTGRTGFVNTLRMGGLLPALIVGALDVGKGALAVWLAQLFWATEPNAWGALFCGLLAMFGHMFPLYLRGRDGGPAFAVAWGAALLFSPWSALFGGLLAVWIAFRVRAPSVAALVGMALITGGLAYEALNGAAQTPVLFGLGACGLLALSYRNALRRWRAKNA
jgi:glycerol-3-phosphate acyltransferase PlsY